ncbi:hypothetical protein [Bradyrhizobium sp. BWA-3-5]|uniref:hypothetical protein n=1 Tax=Bradyrhizobium sp. BWA-3-5 TaxID=3080013 RepID=UPI00293E0B59|nr:hypothetical protein [Bradyrhizobium sp. BWA-3-5]WOH62931.1 hypothetical protein RX331_19500 [Bradyrhizobium sp. BWA-3-5]
MAELPILIIGGGGKTDARVPALLQARGVEAARDRPARIFADYARRSAATGIWRA